MAVLRERTEATALFVDLPFQEEIDRGFKECCYKNLVLADQNSSDDEKNDYTGFYFQRQTSTDTCDFVLIRLSDSSEFSLNSGTYGTFKALGSVLNNQNMSTILVDWKSVLTLLGSGGYRIRKDITIGGISITLESNTYHLEQYTTDRADNTIRIDILMNGWLKEHGLKFEAMDFNHSLRVRGFFGNRQVGYDQRNNIYRNKNRNEQSSMEQKNTYVLQTELIPDCISNDVIDFMLLSNDIFINDYNANNHSYKYKKFPVTLSGSDSMEYWSNNRKVRLNLEFEDRYLNKRKTNCS